MLIKTGKKFHALSLWGIQKNENKGDSGKVYYCKIKSS